MPRGYQYSYAANHGNHDNPVLRVADSFVRSKRHKGNIDKALERTIEFSCLLGPKQIAVAALVEDDVNGQNAEFLNDLRNKMKVIAKENIRQKGDWEVLSSAVMAVAKEATHSTDGSNDDAADLNYEKLIEEKIVQIQAAKETQGAEVFVESDPAYAQVLEAMGEKSKNRNNDDDIELVEEDEAGGGVSEQLLKCPITSLLMEDAVKNKVCGHIYSKQGVLSLFRSRNRSCPMPGCMNRNMNQDQLQDDIITRQKVKRFKKRKQQESQMENDEDVDVVV